MKNVLTMAGNFASHAIWNVSSGDTLVPIVGFLKGDGTHHMERLMMGSGEAVSVGEIKINQLTDEHTGATFIKDGFVTLESGKTDALIVDVTFSDNSDKKVQFLIPYRNANHQRGFAVHRLKITKASGFESDDYGWISDAFFDGLESHEQGGKIWLEQYEDQAGESSGHYGDENTDFAKEDFEKLKLAPFLIFFFVAGADGKIDKKEVTVFMELLTSSEYLSNPLFNRVITNVINDVPTIISELANQTIDYIAELSMLKLITDRYLVENEANEFKILLLLLGQKIAQASTAELDASTQISQEENAALAAIAVCLGVNV